MDTEASKQCFVAVQFGSDETEPVMIPVDDLNVLEHEDQKQCILESAWEYFHNGEFAREIINPSFIEGSANDLAARLKINELVAPLVVNGLAELYVTRLKDVLESCGEKAVDSNAIHLKLTRVGDSLDITFEPPDGWQDSAVEKISSLAQDLHSEAKDSPLSWYRFAEWLWINQATGALCDLEQEVGSLALEQMSEEEFERTLVHRILEHEDSAQNIGTLIFRRIEHIAKIIVDAVGETLSELWELEQLLGFRKLPPPKESTEARSSLLVRVDFSHLLRCVSQEPEHLYRLPPRRFEELIAHLFEGFGYEVTLTPESRDGGYDISAVRKAEVDTRVLIECKRYTPPHKVGRPIVQRLMGVICDRDVQATMGIVATSSTFTRDAEAYIAANGWKLQGRDVAGISAWIKDFISR